MLLHLQAGILGKAVGSAIAPPYLLCRSRAALWLAWAILAIASRPCDLWAIPGRSAIGLFSGVVSLFASPEVFVRCWTTLIFLIHELALIRYKVTDDRGYADAASDPVPQPTVLTIDDDVMKSTLADNNLPKRPCSAFFKIAHKALNIHSSFQDLSNIGIMPSSVRCLQTVSERAYVINFSHPKDCGIFF